MYALIGVNSFFHLKSCRSPTVGVTSWTFRRSGKHSELQVCMASAQKKLWKMIYYNNTVFGGGRSKERKIWGVQEHINTVAGDGSKMSTDINI